MASVHPDPGESPALPNAAAQQPGPTVVRIMLGAQLRRLRQQCGISREDAGQAIRGSHAKISRMELGQVSVKERDLVDLLSLYGVGDGAELDSLLELARRANAPAWWQRYSDVLPSWFQTYLGLEQDASVIRAYESQFLPGLLQCADYARAVAELAIGATAEEIERRVEVRIRRQRLLTGAQPPTFWAVLDEAALRRHIGSPAVMHAQIDHLLEVCQLPNVSLQIVLYRSGGHPAAGGPFTILRFPEPDLSDIVYLEQLTSAIYLDKRAEIDHYQLIMERLAVQAETPERTPDALRAIAATL